MFHQLAIRGRGGGSCPLSSFCLLSGPDLLSTVLPPWHPAARPGDGIYITAHWQHPILLSPRSLHGLTSRDCAARHVTSSRDQRELQRDRSATVLMYVPIAPPIYFSTVPLYLCVFDLYDYPSRRCSSSHSNPRSSLERLISWRLSRVSTGTLRRIGLTTQH